MRRAQMLTAARLRNRVAQQLCRRVDVLEHAAPQRPLDSELPGRSIDHGLRREARGVKAGDGVEIREAAKRRLVEDYALVARDHAQIGGPEINREFGPLPGKDRSHDEAVASGMALVSRNSS